MPMKPTHMCLSEFSTMMKDIVEEQLLFYRGKWLSLEHRRDIHRALNEVIDEINERYEETNKGTNLGIAGDIIDIIHSTVLDLLHPIAYISVTNTIDALCVSAKHRIGADTTVTNTSPDKDFTLIYPRSAKTRGILCSTHALSPELV